VHGWPESWYAWRLLMPALARDPDRVDRVALAEIPGSPGTVQAPPLFLPGPLNDRLRHLPDDVIDYYYVRMLSNPGSLRGNFGWYRALDTTIAQDEQRKSRRLTMPVFAIGGETSFGEHVGEAVQAVADDVQSVVIPAAHDPRARATA
jgi:pimeloyl-ACP methyl ester carboxylesterase